jgi:hypothetical protein
MADQSQPGRKRTIAERQLLSRARVAARATAEKQSLLSRARAASPALVAQAAERAAEERAQREALQDERRRAGLLARARAMQRDPVAQPGPAARTRVWAWQDAWAQGDPAAYADAQQARQDARRQARIRKVGARAKELLKGAGR